MVNGQIGRVGRYGHQDSLGTSLPALWTGRCCSLRTPAATVPVAVQYRGLPKPPSAIRPLGGCDVVMVPFGPDRMVLHGSDAQTHPEGATMPQNRVLAVGLAIVLLAGACQGGEDSDPAERADEAGSGAAVTSEDESLPDERSGSSITPGDEPQGALQPDVAAPVRLGERFGWCARVQALWDGEDQARTETEAAAAAHAAAVRVHEAATDDLDRAEAAEAAQDAYADYVFAAGDYGKIRWRAAGLIFSNEAIVLGGGVEDSTLQVALDRAFEAYRVAAAADTVAAFDFAHEATETAAQLTAAAYSDSDEPQGVEDPEPEQAPLDASQAWFRATEALQDAVESAQDADDAKDATSAAALAAQAAAGDAEDAAWAIYRAAQADGDWESITADTRAHVAPARSAAEAAAGFATDAVDAHTATQTAAEAARIAALASEAARALAEQHGTTEGAEAYWDMRGDLSSEGLSPRHDAAFSASVAAAIIGPVDRYVANAATAVADAAWRAGQVFASVDHRGVAAFKESLQQSCR